MIDLKPCPFCGSKKVKIYHGIGRKFINGLDEPIEQLKFYVRCNKCYARGSIASGKVNRFHDNVVDEEIISRFPVWQTTTNELMKKAAELWNRITEFTTRTE